MKSKIKIAFSGAHSTGKTSFIKELSKLLKNRNIDFSVVSDLAVNCPLPILREHTIESTLWIASKGIVEEIEAQNNFEVVLVDRPIIDCWAYFNAVCKDQYNLDDPKLKTLLGLIKNWTPTYDITYQTVINKDIPIENNKGRDLDEDYRNLIQKELIDINHRFKFKPKSLSYDDHEIELKSINNLILKLLNK